LTGALAVTCALLACTLAGLSSAGIAWLIRSQPAVVAAPGVQMRWPTRPGAWASVVKRYETFMEIQTCELALVGWSAKGVLFYTRDCRNSPARTWAYDPGQGARPCQVAAVRVGLVQDAVSASVIRELVRSPSVRPRDAEPMVRNLAVRSSGPASPGGRWLAVVVRHVYGPEHVIVLED
jgi:hypothetical protein